MEVELNDNGSEFLYFYSSCMKACTITNIKLPKSCEPNHFIVIGPDGNGIGLDKTLLKELLPHLKAWIETGSFEIQEEKDAFSRYDLRTKIDGTDGLGRSMQSVIHPKKPDRNGE